MTPLNRDAPKRGRLVSGPRARGLAEVSVLGSLPSPAHVSKTRYGGSWSPVSFGGQLSDTRIRSRRGSFHTSRGDGAAAGASRSRCLSMYLAAVRRATWSRLPGVSATGVAATGFKMTRPT